MTPRLGRFLPVKTAIVIERVRADSSPGSSKLHVDSLRSFARAYTVRELPFRLRRDVLSDAPQRLECVGHAAVELVTVTDALAAEIEERHQTGAAALSERRGFVS